jgi:hypothetical protein
MALIERPYSERPQAAGVPALLPAFPKILIPLYPAYL